MILDIKRRLTTAKIKMAVLAGVVMWIMVFSQLVINVICEKRVSITEAFAIGDEISVKRYSNEIVAQTEGLSSDDTIKKIMDCSGCSNYNVERKGASVNVTGKVEKYQITVTISEINNKKYLHYIICNEEGYYNSYIPDECYKKSENVMRLLEENGEKSIRYTRFDGQIKGNLSQAQCKKYTQKIYERINAEMVSEHYDTDYTSYGYSDNFENEVKSGKNKINIHVRFNYNEIDGNTEIVVATPIIMD